MSNEDSPMVNSEKRETKNLNQSKLDSLETKDVNRSIRPAEFYCCLVKRVLAGENDLPIFINVSYHDS